MDLALLFVLLLAIISLTLAARLLRPAERRADVDAVDDPDAADVAAPSSGLRRRGGPVNTRKAEKQREKEERRQHREAMLEAQRQRQAEQALQRAADADREREAERLEAEHRRAAVAAAESAADEEYLRWKRTMTVVTSGFASEECPPLPDLTAVRTALLAEIHEHRLCSLINLSERLDVPVSQLQAVIRELERNGCIDGVLDDGGETYLSLTENNLRDLVHLITDRGRVSLADLDRWVTQGCTLSPAAPQTTPHGSP